MAWARIDDGFHDHPKVDELDLAAVGLWTLCLTWAHRHRRTALTPGHITSARVRKVAAKQGDALAAQLVQAGLWDEQADIDGWVIHDFEDYLPKQRDPSERREAGRKGAARRWETDGKLPSEDMASDSSRASAPASPSRPVPSQGETQESGDRSETLRAASATEPTCSKHPFADSETPCAGCARVRAWRDQNLAKARDEAQRARETCPDCGGGIWLDDGTKCTHRRSKRSA